MSVRKILKAAIDKKQSVVIRYMGGSQPGTIREIIPNSIDGGNVLAVCMFSRRSKVFTIKKIEIPDELNGAERWENQEIKKKKYSNIDEFLDANLANLEELGWIVNRDELSVSLHRRFKNGKPLSAYDVALKFEEFEYFFDLNGQFDPSNKEKRTRPWVLHSNNIATRTYGKLSSAAHEFLKQATILSPNKK